MKVVAPARDRAVLRLSDLGLSDGLDRMGTTPSAPKGQPSGSVAVAPRVPSHRHYAVTASTHLWHKTTLKWSRTLE